MNIRHTCASLLVGMLGLFLPHANGEETVSAVTKDGVHPVLLRKDFCDIGQIAIEVKDSDNVELKGFTISLDGTTDVSEIASIRVFDTGSKNKFATMETFGEPVDASTIVTIDGDRQLHPGRNVFWIACTLKDSAKVGDRVRAECVEVKTSAGTIVPEVEGNRTGHRVGVALRQAGDDGVHTFRIPALGTTTRGTLLCVYDIRRKSSRDLQGDIDVGLSRSTDGGQTWEPMKVIMDMGSYGGLPEDQNGIGDPGLVIDRGTGEIFVFALWVHAKPKTHQWRGNGSEPGYEIGKTAQFMVVRSTDDGKTWSKPENITKQVKKEDWMLFAPSPQQGIQLTDGTLVMPVQGRSEKDKTFATVLISDDHGKTWSAAEGAYVGGNECQAAELADGSIMLNVRNGGKKRRAVVVSDDKGKTWKEHPTHEQLVEPTCNGSLYRWVPENGSDEDALLLFANPQDEKRRIRHTIQVSSDDGKTWPKSRRLLLDEGQGFGYPSLSRVDDDHIGIVYEGSQSHLIFEKISREELMGSAKE